MFRRIIAPLAGVLLLTVVLSACNNTKNSMRDRMQSWANDQSYVSAESIVKADLAGIAAGIRLHDLRGVRTDCVGFSTDIDQIYGGLPAPDRTVTNELNVAITEFWGPGSESCYAAKSFANAKFITFRHDLRLGEAVYAEAQSRIHSYGIH
jgi:hypothetical protein